jgi:hypothetical protein
MDNVSRSNLELGLITGAHRRRSRRRASRGSQRPDVTRVVLAAFGADEAKGVEITFVAATERILPSLWESLARRAVVHLAALEMSRLLAG